MAELPITTSATREAIFAAYEANSEDGFRAHLGASIIGKPCERSLWYDFRWVKAAKFPGRVLRLFETGQLEEARLVRNLRATGATVLEVDPQSGRQFRVSAHGGHFGGSMDAVALNLLEAPSTWHVLEFKTHSAKSFRDLQAKGVTDSKPQHFAQMQVYMHLSGLKRAMYVAVNKDTDDLYVERVRLDADFAKGLLAKAARVIFSATPPERITEDSSWYQCRFCDHAALCHSSKSGAPAVAAAINCRTCLHSSPVEGGWQCALTAESLSDSEQRSACMYHLYLPQLVNADQIDVGSDWIEYRLRDGRIWRDSGAPKHFASETENEGALS